MAKMRVHELAKELEIKSQEIIDSLSGTEYEIKSASNNIDDAAQEIIRKKYKKSAPKAEEKPAAEKAEKPAAPKAEEKARPEEKKPADAEHDRPKKKSSITAVFNAQYSKQGAGHGNNRRPNQGAKGGRPQDGRRPANDRGDRPAGQAKPAMSGNDMRKYFDSLINPNAGKETENSCNYRCQFRNRNGICTQLCKDGLSSDSDRQTKRTSGTALRRAEGSLCHSDGRSF